jgi:hypothetical protein
MENNNTSKHHYFYAVGLSYKKQMLRLEENLVWMLLQSAVAGTS